MSQLLIHLHNIFKSFGPKKIFDGISLSISRGECFALVGENGSGKTTLLRLFASIDVPDEGAIERAKELSIGYLCQEASRFFNANGTGVSFQLIASDRTNDGITARSFGRPDDLGAMGGSS